jgi:hypothetical protein
LLATGESCQVDADFYDADGDEWSCMTSDAEVLRVKMAEVVSISKAH